jgi:recombination DNA repair RAD52 pathway protein
MTDKQTRDKIAHAFRDYIKQSESNASVLHGGQNFLSTRYLRPGELEESSITILSATTSATVATSSTTSTTTTSTTETTTTKSENVIHPTVRTMREDSTLFRYDDSNFVSSMNGTKELDNNNSNNNNLDVGTISNHHYYPSHLPHRSIYDFVVADLQFTSSSSSTGTVNNNDWFLQVIEWTLGQSTTPEGKVEAIER